MSVLGVSLIAKRIANGRYLHLLLTY